MKELLERHEELSRLRLTADRWATINGHSHGKFIKDQLGKLIEANSRLYIRVDARHKDALLELVEIQSREQTLREIEGFLLNAESSRNVLDEELKDVVESMRMIEAGPEDISIRQPNPISVGETDE